MTVKISSICVFCGSSSSPDPVFDGAARRMGQLIAAHGLELIYGGGKTGMMGALAGGALESGCRVTGITYKREAAHAAIMGGLHRVEILDTLPQRKGRMVDLADAFIILPGGYGTMDEFFDVLAMAQVGLHSKPIALLDVAGYFDDLVAWIERAAQEGYIGSSDRGLFLIESDPELLLQKLLSA
jgi:uncharacterized protein (TIGR00730 family)